jgi:hypothetical protein
MGEQLYDVPITEAQRRGFGPRPDERGTGHDIPLR